MQRSIPLLAALLLLAVSAVRAQEEDPLAAARERVRDFESDIQELIDRVSPAVGAVTNFGVILDPKTGAVVMRPRGQGSGTVVTRDGFFLTNVHVVLGAGYITVALPDGVRYPAVLYADTSEGEVKGDIALLKLRGRRDFPYVDWKRGDATKLKPGSFVFAMGNPRGLAFDGTPVVTMGIISGKSRAASGAQFLYVDSLQSDVEINPGNSGGPLFDSHGNFVGINGLMRSRSGRSYSGVGFSIPVNQVRLFMGRLLRDEGGGVGYGYHGLQIQSAEDGKGAVVRRIAPASPAEVAGMRRGDIVTKVNGKRVANQSDFQNVVTKLPEGAPIRLGFLRGRKKESIAFRLGSYREWLEEVGAKKTDQPLPMNERGYLGVHWKEDRGGLRITRVLPGTGAEKGRLREEDLLRKLDGASIPNAKVLVEILARKSFEDRVEIEYDRGGQKRKVRIDLCDAATAAGLGEEG